MLNLDILYCGFNGTKNLLNLNQKNNFFTKKIYTTFVKKQLWL